MFKNRLFLENLVFGEKVRLKALLSVKNQAFLYNLDFSQIVRL